MTAQQPGGDLIGPRRIVRRTASMGEPRYSLCTMVTRWQEYSECLASFRERGFGVDDCEVLTIDNADSNLADAYQAVNEFLQAASGTYVVLVHQDVLLIDDDRAALDRVLDELSSIDPNWALCGNSGRAEDSWPAIRLTDPHGDDFITGAPFPARVVGLDENFIVVRREANLAASRDLAGFHHYGADLCTIADILGWNAYVIDFHLLHKSGGTLDEKYTRSHRAIGAKYARALRPRWVHLSTRQSFFVSGRPAEAAAARLLRYIGKVVGLVPRHHHFDDERRRTRRDARRQRRGLP